jgi:inorganic pyrophosphatase
MTDLWTRLDGLIASNTVVIDRPRGSRHPRYPEIVYPLDYGYLKGTSGGDGNEIDVWRGSMLGNKLTGIVCTVDIMKGDAGIKLLIGCTNNDIDTASRFLNNDYMSAIVIRRAERYLTTRIRSLHACYERADCLTQATITQFVTLILNEKKSFLHLSACRHPDVCWWNKGSLFVRP